MVIERAIVLVVHRPSRISRSRVPVASRHCDRQASSSHHHRRFQQRSIGACRRSISRSCSASAASMDLNLASSTVQRASRSMMIGIESSSLIPTIIECKYCRRSMARSCSSSAPKATNHASSSLLREYASIIKVESSSPTPTIVDCNHSLTKAITSRPSIVASRSHQELRSTSIEVSSPSRRAIECM